MIKKIIQNDIKKLLPDILKKPLKYLRDNFVADRSEINRISKIPRYSEGCTKLLGHDLKFSDSASFLYMYNEIFNKEIYKFNSKTSKPFILDCGANIGLSIIYFKKSYPDAEIIGFEPDKKLFDLITFNINSFSIKDVRLINKGLWNEATTLKFFSEGADGGRVALEEDNENIVEINTVSLRDYLNKTVDLLKIDIEGSEIVVLKDCKELLHNVKNLFIEYHSFVNKGQELDTLLEILSMAGFRYYIEHVGVNSAHPFCDRNTYQGMDLQQNIYGYRL